MRFLSGHPLGVAVVFVAAGRATAELRQILPAPPDLDAQQRTLVAARLVGRGGLSIARGVPRAAMRAWPPLVPLLAVVRPRAAVIMVAGWTLDVLALRRRRHTRDLESRGDLPLLAELGGKLLDDLAYAAGLWWGAWRAKSIAALVPRRTRPSAGRRPLVPRTRRMCVEGGSHRLDGPLPSGIRNLGRSERTVRFL